MVVVGWYKSSPHLIKNVKCSEINARFRLRDALSRIKLWGPLLQKKKKKKKKNAVEF